jgi:uncharacterized protein (UPF0371 family)
LAVFVICRLKQTAKTAKASKNALIDLEDFKGIDAATGIPDLDKDVMESYGSRVGSFPSYVTSGLTSEPLIRTRSFWPGKEN